MLRTTEIIKINNRFFSITDYKDMTFLDEIFENGSMNFILCIDNDGNYRGEFKSFHNYTFYDYHFTKNSKIINFDILPDNIKNHLILEYLKE